MHATIHVTNNLSDFIAVFLFKSLVFMVSCKQLQGPYQSCIDSAVYTGTAMCARLACAVTLMNSCRHKIYALVALLRSHVAPSYSLDHYRCLNSGRMQGIIVNVERFLYLVSALLGWMYMLLKLNACLTMFGANLVERGSFCSNFLSLFSCQLLLYWAKSQLDCIASASA
jgi:hypothetical protein